MLQALDEYEIEGVVTNIPLVRRVLQHPAFAEADYDTAIMAQVLRDPPQDPGNGHVAAIALAMLLQQDAETHTMPSKWKMHGRRMAMVNRLSNGVP